MTCFVFLRLNGIEPLPDAQRGNNIGCGKYLISNKPPQFICFYEKSIPDSRLVLTLVLCTHVSILLIHL